jgi:hypothetical protein
LLIALLGNINDIQAGKEFSQNPLDPLQYGLFRLPKGEILQRHLHKVRSRLKKHKTLEFLYIVSGKLRATFYSLQKAEIAKVIMVAGDFVMLIDGGHGFNVLEDNTVFIEVKNGQYTSVSSDKEKF